MLLSSSLMLCTVLLAQDVTRTALDEEDIRNWTPDIESRWRNPEWRRFGEEKIHDDRFMEIDYGPVYGASIRVQGARDRTIARAHKGLALRLGGKGEQPEAMVVYDRNLLQCQGGWIGGWLDHDDGRFGLMDVPTNAAEPLFAAPAAQAFRRGGESFDVARASQFFPLPVATGRFMAVHLHGDDVVLSFDVGGTRVLEHAALEHAGATPIPPLADMLESWAIVRHLEVAPDQVSISLRLYKTIGNRPPHVLGDGELAREGGWWVLTIPPGEGVRRCKIVHAHAEPDIFDAPPRDLAALLEGDHPLRWQEILETTIEQSGTAGPYVHERILPPFDNPWKSLMFLGGLDVLPDGRPIVSTLFGDVWTVSNIDTGRPAWKRFATGLFQPLGIRVVDGRILVMERGQLTELIDHDADGEADEYRNINNRWHTSGDPHCYDINLETDPEGNFYFIKNGAWHTPTGGCLLRIAADGTGDAEIYATGFRHCNSLGISPTGQLASGGQQGTWQPATRLDLNHEGGFYGLMEAAHREVDFYDRPLLWMPLEADNSAGDPVWAPAQWGPLGGSLLHLSWGQCWLMRILEEEVDGIRQGAAIVLPLGRFMAGPARGRFSPVDGNLWVAGTMGWQTWGPWDGTLDRIRYTGPGETLVTPSALRTLPGELELCFDVALDRSIALVPERYSVLQWNYHWSHGYGSAHWRTTVLEEEGEDEITVESVSLSRDGSVLRLAVPGLRPAMQTRIGWELLALDGRQVSGIAYATTHRLPLASREAIDMLAEPHRMADEIFQDVEIEVAWTGDGNEAVLLLRALPGDDGFRAPVSIPLSAEGPGTHHLLVVMHDRHIRAILDGEVILDERETDTRVPLAGRIMLDGADALGDRLQHFTVRPVAPPYTAILAGE